MNKLTGLLYTCGLLPAAYAALAYIGAEHQAAGPASVHPAELAVLVALPLVVSGAVKWWDIWCHPAPKLGAGWQALPPAVYLSHSCRNHAVVMASAVAFHFAFGTDSEHPVVSMAPAALVALSVLGTSLHVPLRTGFHSGQPIQ